MLEQAAEPGSATFHLGAAQLVGDGIPQDVAKAMRRWWMAVAWSRAPPVRAP